MYDESYVWRIRFLQNKYQYFFQIVIHRLYQEAEYTNFIVFWLDPTLIVPTIYHPLGEYTLLLHRTNDLPPSSPPYYYTEPTIYHPLGKIYSPRGW
jgi:hypothetical protein